MAYLGFGSQFAFIAIVDESMQRAADEAGVNLVFIDNEFSPEKALENAELVASRGDVDLVYEFNYYQQQNYTIADIFKEAGIPVIAIDIPVPGATYYGGDNYAAGKIAGLALADWAKAKWVTSPSTWRWWSSRAWPASRRWKPGPWALSPVSTRAAVPDRGAGRPVRRRE